LKFVFFNKLMTTIITWSRKGAYRAM